MSHTALLSSLVRYQLPEFIREDYDTFVTFIEAYYEFLEQTNGAIDFSKHLLQYQDVDRTLTEFEEYFIRTYLPLISTTTVIDKATLIKHAKTLYASKGTKKSFEFLFRALFGEDVSVFYPKDNILRASDGKWIRRESLRIEPAYWSLADGDGTTTSFRLFEAIRSAGDLEVYIDGVLQTSGYTTSPNTPTITFDTAPADGAVLKFVYRSRQLIERIARGELILEFTGTESAAKAVSEIANETTLSGVRAFEIFITPRGSKTFTQGEVVTSVYGLNDESVTLYFQLISVLGSIQVRDGGANYNVGDPVIVTGGGADRDASAAVESVYRALITKIYVRKGGAGFKSGDGVTITSTPNTGLGMSIFTVDTSEYYHANTLTLIDEDIISLYANVPLNSTNYGFPVAGVENTSTRIVDALTFGSVIGLGPITNVAVLNTTFEFATTPILQADSPVLTFTSSNANTATISGTIRIVDLGIIGRLSIDRPGAGYVPGDELIFTNILTERGVGAAGEVTEVTATGGVRTVKLQPPRIPGSVSATQNTAIVTGSSTNFLGELRVGDRIEINNESRYINAITSNTSLNVNVAWTKTSSSRSLGVYGKNFIGGSGYRQAALPTVSIASANTLATGAQISATAIYGDGEELVPLSEHDPGEIASIIITNPGSGYASAPTIDLTQSGDGTATAIASLLASKFTYPGRFATTDSLLSSDRHLEDRDYYQNFSYVLQSRVDFNKYKQVLLDLLHPVGMKFFGEYAVDEQLLSVPRTLSTETILLERPITGTVNVGNGSALVIGTNTFFLSDVELDILVPGTTSIQVNNEVRVVNSIINNTSLTVTTSFTYTANDQTMIAFFTPPEELSNTLTTQLGDYIVTQDENFIAYQ